MKDNKIFELTLSVTFQKMLSGCYLVTGGTGFLGQHLVPLVLAQGGRVKLYCRSQPIGT